MSLFGNLLQKAYNDITVVDLKERLDQGDKAVYIDVRTPGEYRSASIKQFKNIPLDQLPNKLGGLPKDKEIVVICQSGGRSASASRFLAQNGFEHVTNVKGGMGAWMMNRF